jgi:hypothetical protein
MVSIICYTNNTRTLEHSHFTSSQLLRQDNSSITIFQNIDDILSGSFYLVCTPISLVSQFHTRISRSQTMVIIQLPIQYILLFLKDKQAFKTISQPNYNSKDFASTTTGFTLGIHSCNNRTQTLNSIPRLFMKVKIIV